MCSSVPPLVREYEAFADRWAGVDLLVLGPGVSTGVPIRYDDPREVGPDRIANAVGATRERAARCPIRRGRLRHLDQLRRRLGRRRVRRRGTRPGRADLDGRALRACGASAQGAVRRPRACDLADDRLGAAVGPRLRLRRAGRRDRRPDPRGAGSSECPCRRHRGPRRVDRAALADDHHDRSGADPAGPPRSNTGNGNR